MENKGPRSPISEEELVLVDGLKRGDEAAFDTFVAQYQPRIMKTALYFLESNRREEAKDVVQDVLLKVYKEIGKFKNQSSLWTWVYKITFHFAMDRYRRSYSRREHCTDSLDQHLELPTDGRLDPLKMVEDGDLRRMMAAKIRRLSEYDQAIIILRVYQGLSLQDAVELLGIKGNTGKVRYSRAMAKLRGRITADPSMRPYLTF